MIQKSIFIGFLLSLVFAWLLLPDHFFLLDDQSHLLRTLLSFPELHLLPQAAYNDRPVGNLFLWGFAQMFGPNPLAAHISILLLHLINGGLIYHLSKILFKKFGLPNTPHLLLAVTAFFLLWQRSTFAVWWLSAVFDLLTVLFGLIYLISAFSIHITNSQKSNLLLLFTSLSALLLSLRSKEAALLLPFALLGLQLSSKQKTQSRLFVYLLGISMTISLIFLFRIFQLKPLQTELFSLTQPYAQSFDLSTLASNAARYLTSYLSPFEFGINFQGFSRRGVAAVLGWGVLTGLAIRRNRSLVPTLLGLGSAFMLILAPTLPLIHTQSKLYLYFPSVFGAIAIVLVLNGAISLLKTKLPTTFYFKSDQLTLAVVICITLIARFLPPAQADISWWLATGKQARMTWESLDQLASVNAGDRFVILGTEGHSHSFLYGPGDVIRLKFLQPEIEVVLGEDLTKISPELQTSPRPPRILEYQPDGSVKIFQE